MFLCGLRLKGDFTYTAEYQQLYILTDIGSQTRCSTKMICDFCIIS